MSLRVRVQEIGAKLSGLILPNLGAFMAWGIITAIGVFSGNEMLKAFIGPMLNYLLPILIAVAGGRMVHGYRGSVIGAVATMGVIIGSDITMFIGAMILGPLAAWLLKKLDSYVEDLIPTGFELLVNNLTLAILGAIISILAYLFLAPAIGSLTTVFAGGVDFLQEKNLLPFTAFFIEPAKILFLNNAIGQGILTPIGTMQLAEAGKSVLFLLESNPGPGLGILVAYMLYGKGDSKANAYGASVIHFFGGIHEIYFPFVLMNPALIIAAIAGGFTGTLLFTLFKVGLVGVSSPGSIITILMMSAVGDQVKIVLAILASAAVTLAIAIPLVKRSKGDDERLREAAKEMEALKGKKSRISSVFEAKNIELDFSTIRNIAYVCDAGLGSSAMGATVLQKKFNSANIDFVKVRHMAVPDLPTEVEVIVTHKSLSDRVRKLQPDTYLVTIDNYLNAPEYDVLVESVVKALNDKE